MYMNSVLTMEERTLLTSLGSPVQADAVRVLDELVMALPIGTEFFYMALALKEKLEREAVDLAFEVRGEGLEVEE